MATALAIKSSVWRLPSSGTGFPRTYASRPGSSFVSFVLSQDEWGELSISAEKRDGTGELRSRTITMAEADAFAQVPVRLRGRALYDLLD